MGQIGRGQCPVALETFAKQLDCGVRRERAAIDEEVGVRGQTKPGTAGQSHDRNSLANRKFEAALSAVLKDSTTIADAHQTYNTVGLSELCDL